MKVLQQLIKHFWANGALTMDQAHYLVESGLIRPRELENYEPRECAPAASAEDGVGHQNGERIAMEVLLPDDLDRCEAALESRSADKRKAGKGKPKNPELTLEQLSEELRPELSVRAGYFPALMELAEPMAETSDFEEAAIALRQQDEEAFRELLLRATHAHPGVLRDLWCAVDASSFHDLLDDVPRGGRVTTAFRAVLNAEAPAAWGSNGWILQVPEVRTVFNLLVVRRLLMAGLAWMLDNDWSRLTKCIRAPRGQSSYTAWNAGFLGLVLVVDARQHRPNRKPVGYRYRRWHGPKTWGEAWATAMVLDPGSVMPLLLDLYGSQAVASHADTPSLSDREDVEILCPYEWKV